MRGSSSSCCQRSSHIAWQQLSQHSTAQHFSWRGICARSLACCQAGRACCRMTGQVVC